MADNFQVLQPSTTSLNQHVLEYDLESNGWDRQDLTETGHRRDTKRHLATRLVVRPNHPSLQSYCDLIVNLESAKPRPGAIGQNV